MRFVSRFLILAAILTLATTSVFAQGGLTGTLTGTVTQDGNPLPGVSVTASSPNLQGTRDTVTNEAGGYSLGALPPGDYTVRFELAGMQSVTQRVKVGVAQTARADAALRLSAMTEAITVTAAAPAVAETTEVQTNITGDVVEELPIGRTVTAITTLSPGVVAGVNGLQISGGQSFDNLYTVNGAVIQENLRGQPHNLFIEDAIQETTVQQAGISAEFGNFTGGVVNVITRSGGNEFSGSFRDSLTNPDWTGSTPFNDNPIDNLNEVYEATLGGRIIRDRLWFFAAGRYSDTATTGTFSNSQRTYAVGTEDRRMEGKLTGAITSRHNIVASYLEAPQTQTNNCQFGCFDETSLDLERELPNDFTTLFYNGVLTNNFLVEAKYSSKNFTFVGSGGEDFNLATGTVIQIAAPGITSGMINEPYFCGVCTDEERNNKQWGAKATYYLGTRALGSHNLVAGYDHWYETRLSNNFQSPTNYRLDLVTRRPTQDANGNWLVSVVPNADFVVWFPIENLSPGSDLNSDAIFLNDKWDLNSKWQFNIGARYDKNDSVDTAGSTVAKDSKLSPRLGATYDVFANGRLRLNANYGVYTGRLAETIASGGSAFGTPASISFFYAGPPIDNVPAAEASRLFFEWFNANGGTTRTARSVSIPGVNVKLAGTLVTPNVEEYSIGASTQIGAGYLRADYIHRDWQDFYSQDRNLQIGRVNDPLGRPTDLQLISNSDDFTREYDAIQLSGAYRLLNRINIGANYTWSELVGDIVGETSGSGPVTTGSNSSIPEYTAFAQNRPVGFLSSDQTHKMRAWASMDFATPVGNFNVSALERFDSGSPYSLSSTIDVRSSANFYGIGQAGGITNPGYVTPPASVTYFFSDRGEFRFEDLWATDLALNYNTNPSWLRGASIFAQGEVTNIFDQDALISHSTGVETHLNNPAACTAAPTGAGCLQRFNPLAGDRPIEGVHWRKNPNFGKALSAADYQTPRTYRISLGVRF